MNLDQALPQGFDALLLPGGVFNPDALRMEPEAVAFVKAFFDAGKGGLDLPRPLDRNRAGAARGRRMTSWLSLKTDLRNARADWVNQELVVDQGPLTSSAGLYPTRAPLGGGRSVQPE